MDMGLVPEAEQDEAEAVLRRRSEEALLSPVCFDTDVDLEGLIITNIVRWVDWWVDGWMDGWVFI